MSPVPANDNGRPVVGMALRLHMGEMTAQELRTVRAAIAWANSKAAARILALEAQVSALSKERASIIATKREQLAALTTERDAMARHSLKSGVETAQAIVAQRDLTATPGRRE